MKRRQSVRIFIIPSILVLFVIFILYLVLSDYYSVFHQIPLDELNIPLTPRKGFQRDYNDLYVITYSDSKFFPALENFIGSIHFWEPELRIVIYDLGMSRKQIREVLSWKNTQFERFNFSLYPPHVMKRQKYAWKSVILNETFHKYGYIFLEDSGQEFRRKIDPIRRLIQKQGFFAMAYDTFDRDKKLTHPLTEQYLNIELHKPHCEGGIIGLMKDHPRGDDIKNFVNDAVTCALREECIAPEGSNIRNHRYDQAVNTLLSQKYNLKCGGIPGCWVGPGADYQLTKDPTQSNDIVICSRRRYSSKQYAQFIMRE